MKDGTIARRVGSLEKTMACALAAAMVSAVWAAEGQEQEPPPSTVALESRIGELVTPFVTNRDFEGVVLVRRRGLEDAFGAYGRFDAGAPRFTTATPFPVGSISKTFTAAAVLRLVARGELALSDRLGQTVPEIPAAGSITIEQLLTHRSGIPDYYALEAFRTARAEPMPLARFATWIAAYEPAFPAGSSESYSNSGYNLLALIVERVSGQGIGAFLETEVLAPASLRATGTMTDSPPAGIPAGLTPAPAPALLDAPAPLHPSWLLGSGSIYASADDVACWGEEVARRMTSGDGWLPYGWGVRGVGRERHFEQNGRIPGYAAVLQVYPSAELVVVVLSRVESDAVMRIAAGVAASALGKAVASEPLRAAAPLTREDQRSYEGVYDIAPGFSLTVGPFRGGLGVAVGVGESLQYGVLQPLGEDRFFFREAYVEVRFERNVDGSVTGILWSGTGPYPRRRPAATAE